MVIKEEMDFLKPISSFLNNSTIVTSTDALLCRSLVQVLTVEAGLAIMPFLSIAQVIHHFADISSACGHGTCGTRTTPASSYSSLSV